MTRHMENLARLLSKMQARYGEHDLLVQDVKRELENLSCADAVAAPHAGRHLTVSAPASGREGGRSRRGYEEPTLGSAH